MNIYGMVDPSNIYVQLVGRRRIYTGEDWAENFRFRDCRNFNTPLDVIIPTAQVDT